MTQSRPSKSDEKTVVEKPKGWNSMSDEAKRMWEERTRRRLRGSATIKEKDRYNTSRRMYRREQAYLQRCRMFQLLIATAFSNPKVVEYLRSKNIHDPFEKVGAVKEKYGQISGATMYVLVKRFKEDRPRPTTDMDAYLTRHQLRKRWIETIRNNTFSEDEAVNDLLEKLSVHPAFGSSYINEHFKVGKTKRQTHDEIVDSAREVYVLWASKNKRNNTYIKKKEQPSNLLMGEEERDKRGGKGRKTKSERKAGEGEDGQEWWLTATCYNCMQTGHIKRNCPKLAQSNNNSSKTKPKHTDTSNHKKTHKKKDGKARKGKRGVTLLRGEVEGDEEGEEQSDDVDSSSEEDGVVGLIMTETNDTEGKEEEEGGGKEQEEKEESESEEPSGQTNTEQPTRVRVGGDVKDSS